jgi:hypothetical protein
VRNFIARVLRWFTEGPFHRWPWLLPLLSFAGGWLGFALVQRGEGMARSIAVMALIGWPWLLAESLLGSWLGRWTRGALSPSLVSFVTQALQQEMLFFALPFLIGAAQRDVGQITFTVVVALGAFVSTIDPIYHARIAAQPAVSVAFHAFCTFVVSLVVLPMAASMPLEQALPVAIAITGGSLLLSLPRTIRGMRHSSSGVVAVVILLSALLMVWRFPGNVPPAGLSLKNSRLTQTLDGLKPGAAIRRIDAQSLLDNGIIAFVAIRAPAGLAQSVTFEWWFRSERLDRVPAEIRGGNEYGWRTYTRKQNFPPDPRGRWRVDVLTPQGQLICRLPLIVD